uniref:glycosyltransferase family 2 protein n=1 Tax=Cephaloticoccus sp. TaxID=1985742 RepID=UPI0040496255
MVSHRDTPFVRLAVRSVWEQTMPDLELIFVDNGSRHDAGNFGGVGPGPPFALDTNGEELWHSDRDEHRPERRAG